MSPWQIYVQPYPTAGVRVRVSTTTGANHVWSSDGKQIFYTTLGEVIKVVAVDMTDPLHPGVPSELFAQPGLGASVFAVDRSGQRFLMSAPADRDVVPPITVVLNWAATLPRK